MHMLTRRHFQQRIRAAESEVQRLPRQEQGHTRTEGEAVVLPHCNFSQYLQQLRVAEEVRSRLTGDQNPSTANEAMRVVIELDHRSSQLAPVALAPRECRQVHV